MPPRACLGQPRVIRNCLAARQQQKPAQAQAVSTTPFDAALAAQAFEIVDQQHPEIATRRQRTPPLCQGRIVQILNEPVKNRCCQNTLKLIVEGMTDRVQKFTPGQEKIGLPILLTAQ